MIGCYDLEMLTPPCDPGSERLFAKARLAVDISPVLPYLNAELPGARYMPEAKALLWNDGHRSIAFHPDEIAVGEVADRANAELVIDELVGLVNRTWERRDQIVPSVAPRPRPTPMAVYRLLPGTNCEECGLPSCWQFALRLVVGEAKVGECPVLTEEEYVSRRGDLRRMVTETVVELTRRR